VKNVQIDIIAPMLSHTEMSCRGCGFIFGFLGLRGKYRTVCHNEYPEEWKERAEALWRWIATLSSLYRHRVRIRIIDAQSPVGLWKQLRYRLFTLPAFIIDKKVTYAGWDSNELEALIDQRVRATCS